MAWKSGRVVQMRSVLLAHSLRIGIQRDFESKGCGMVRDAQCEKLLLLLDAWGEDVRQLRAKSEAQFQFRLWQEVGGREDLER
jgi:hypothetical protein